nr:ribosomal protein subunit L5, mitochondrial [Tanacetum cinerariifolium]
LATARMSMPDEPKEFQSTEPPDVSHQYPLLKPNHANVMKVPGSCKIRVVPTAAPSDFIIKNGKLAMEISCSQKLIQTQRASTGKSFRSNPFLGSNKDKKGYVSDLAWQSTLRGNGMSHFLVRISAVTSLRFSGRNTGKVHSILDGNGVLRILPGTGRSFRDLRTYSRVQCHYCNFGQHTR